MSTYVEIFNAVISLPLRRFDHAKKNIDSSLQGAAAMMAARLIHAWKRALGPLAGLDIE